MGKFSRLVYNWETKKKIGCRCRAGAEPSKRAVSGLRIVLCQRMGWRSIVSFEQHWIGEEQRAEVRRNKVARHLARCERFLSLPLPWQRRIAGSSFSIMCSLAARKRQRVMLKMDMRQRTRELVTLYTDTDTPILMGLSPFTQPCRCELQPLTQ